MSEIIENTDEVLESNIAEELNFVEVDAEVINADIVSSFEEQLGETLALGDERRIFLQAFAYALADQLIHINETGRSNLLRYAIDDELDALGEDIFRNKRLTPQYATVTMRFTLSGAQSKDVTVPKGTRVTPDGTVFFATDEAITFEANTVEFTKDVTATATVAGSEHNGYEIGDINQLVDTNQYVSKVENITKSGGGSDEESDADYRARLRESPFSFSVAGPANSYRAIAMAVSGSIADVAVYSPSAGVVEIAVIKEGGEIPSEDDELLTEIYNACDDKNSRPLTDKVQVVPASAVNVNINLEYYVENSDASKIVAIESAIDKYIAWQTAKIGRNIDPDELNMRMREAGAARVVISEPVYQILAENEIAQIGTVNAVNKGSITSKSRSL